jgi:hypothetical protein
MQITVFISNHHRPEEDAFTARVAADLEAAGPGKPERVTDTG